jgi:hypothetical protein
MRRLRIVAVAISAVLAVAIGGPWLPSAANAGPRHNTAGGTRQVSAGGYAIEVPSSWKVVAIKAVSSIDGCSSIKGPTVFVGSFTDLDGCVPFTLTQNVVLFGSGGPPFSPIPDIYDGDQTFHGVTLQVLTGAETLEHASYLLALFPGRTTWLLMAAPGSSPGTALEQARQVLSTVRPAGGPSTTRPVPPIHESFVGSWQVHDALLDISSDTAGHLGYQADLQCACSETDYLLLSLSAHGSQLNAVVTGTATVNEKTDKAVPNPEHTKVGTRFFFEFMEPHLMLRVALPTEPPDLAESFGNPYWCGAKLAPQFSPACGA